MGHFRHQIGVGQRHEGRLQLGRRAIGQDMRSVVPAGLTRALSEQLVQVRRPDVADITPRNVTSSLKVQVRPTFQVMVVPLVL